MKTIRKHLRSFKLEARLRETERTYRTMADESGDDGGNAKKPKPEQKRQLFFVRTTAKYKCEKTKFWDRKNVS